MKKSYLYAIIVVLLLVIMGGGVFIIINMSPDSKDRINEETERNEIADTIKYEGIRKESDIIKENFSVVINGKSMPLEVEFKYTSGDDYEQIEGKMNGVVVYSENYEPDIETKEKKLEEKFTQNYIGEKFGKDNLQFIKGEDDKNYLLVISQNSHFFAGQYDYLYVYNDDLELLKGDVNYNGCSNDEAFTVRIESSGHKSEEEPGKSGYPDTLGLYEGLEKDYYLNLKIEDNKIYYLKAKQNITGENDYGTLEERVYTIKNNKLEYTVKNTFKITWVAGMAC